MNSKTKTGSPDWRGFFKFLFKPTRLLAVVALVFTTACGDGGGGTTTYTVGVDVSGFTGTVVLQNNSVDDLSITADGTFTFATELADGSTYAVTVSTQPDGQTCSVTSGSGTISGADVTSVTVDCVDSSTYNVGGYVSGLTGTLALQNKSGDDLPITEDGTFTFATVLADGSTYAVTVLIQPDGQTCSVTSGSGIISGANLTNVSVDCVDNSPDTYTVGGDVSGFTGTVVLQNNRGDNLSLTADGAFNFATAIADSSTYSVTVLTLPTGLACSVSNGSGTISGADVINVAVSCTASNSGTLDTTFADGGIVIHDNAAGGNGSDKGSSITTDSAGRILVAGQSSSGGSNGDMVIWRYNPDGTLDSSFDSDGFVVHNDAVGGDGWVFGSSVTTDSVGKILVTGQSNSNGSNSDMVTWRYNPDGTLDSSFDSNGFVVHDNAAGGNGGDWGRSSSTDSTGRILVTGASDNGSNFDMVIWRYNPDGTLDTSFDSDGIVVHDNAAGGNSDDLGRSMSIDSTGRILVTGSSNNGSNDDMIIWRYNPDGSLDTNFDTDGIVVHGNAAGGDNRDSGYSITIDSASRILVAGSSDNGSDSDMVIWRYNPDGSLDTNFDSDGIVVYDNTAGDNSGDYGYSITIDSTDRILVTGISTSVSNGGMVIWRYNTNGTLDSTFDGDGIMLLTNAAGGNGTDFGSALTTDSDGKILVTGWSSNGSDDDMVIWRIIP